LISLAALVAGVPALVYLLRRTHSIRPAVAIDGAR